MRITEECPVQQKMWHQTIHRLFSQHITPMQWGLNCLVLAKTFSLWVLHRNLCTLLQGLFWYLAKYKMLRLQHTSLDSDKLDRHVFEHPASQQLMPCPTLLPFVAHKCPSIHALPVRNGYVDEYVDHGNRSACGGKWELQKSAVHDNLSHSMLLRFHWYQYQSGSIMIFHEISLQFLERQTFYFILRGFLYIKPLVCFEVAMIYLSKYHRNNEYAERILNCCEETSAGTESWRFT